MTKIQFLLSLNKKLSGLPQNEIEERLNFYSEMIEDRMEEGLSEEDSVAAIGSVDEIAAQTISEIHDSNKEDETPEQKNESVADNINSDNIMVVQTENESKKSTVEEKPNNTKHKKQPNSLVILLLVLGFPLWFSLLITAVVIVFSIYISLWSVIISLWSVFASIIGCAIGFIILSFGFLFVSNNIPGIAMLGAAIICIGVSILVFYGCKAATMGLIWLTKKSAAGIKNCFIKKEKAHA